MKNIKVKWPKVLNYLNIDQRPIINWIDLGNGTMFRIFAFFSYMGADHPRDGLMVAIERKGSFFFRLDNKISYDYVCEKLNLCEADARPIADWINAQLGLDVPQQGDYCEKYIKEVEPYNLIGEHSQMPLVPEIISE